MKFFTRSPKYTQGSWEAGRRQFNSHLPDFIMKQKGLSIFKWQMEISRARFYQLFNLWVV